MGERVVGQAVEGGQGCDSREETWAHIEKVRSLLSEVIQELELRAKNHDQTKLGSMEKPYFDRLTPLLRDVKYGSGEYQKVLLQMQPALNHHYANNSHHPEFYFTGVSGMNLVDLVEMLCDWKASSLRHNTGDIMRSIDVNTVRFKLEPQLRAILENTVFRMRW